MDKYFFIYSDEWGEALDMLNDLQLGKLMRSLIRFHKDGEKINKEGNEDIYLHFLFMSSRITHDKQEHKQREEREKAKKEQFREWGKRGGRPRKNKPKEITLETKNKDIELPENEKEKEKDSGVQNQKRKVKKFIKPTPEIIQKYCDERNNGISGDEFYDFYNSKGWKIGNSSMKDWKSAIRTWERNRKNNGYGSSGVKPISRTILKQPQEYQEF